MTFREEHAAYVLKMHQALDAAINEYGFDADFHEQTLNRYGIVARLRALTPSEIKAESAVRALACLEAVAG